MCGIVGVLDTRTNTTTQTVAQMARTLEHRGPDDAGVWQSDTAQCTFGFQRLSFFDVSDTGHQPMTHGQLTIVFNGEIYNHELLRQELEQHGHTFVGGSDTEVVLHAWREWGAAAVDKFRGMFAFAIHDAADQSVRLYRDRFGVKPLYYYYQDGLFAFASEMKALLAHPVIKGHATIDRDAAALFFQLSYIPAPWSIFAQIKKLPAAHCLHYTADGSVECTRYWDINEHYSTQAPMASKADVIDELDRRCQDAFSLRMLSDRPVGMFLSGGIDSSVVAGVLAQSTKHLETFTIGFSESDHDESVAAQTIAAHLGTTHHTRTCTAAQAQAIIPTLPHVYDEPFGDASAIPTCLVSQFARESVVASLSADGGDELFGGYTSYPSMVRLVRMLRTFSFVGGSLTITAAVRAVRAAVALRILPQRLLHKAEKVQALYPLRNDIPRLFSRFHSHFATAEAEALLGGASTVSAADVFAAQAPTLPLGVQRTLQHLDLHLYMTDDILVKVDRATMSASLEGREPLLDHQLVEYVAGLSDEVLLDPAVSKSLLRSVLYRYVPKQLVDRPKQGFGVPLDSWLKKELRDVLDTYLAPDRIAAGGILDPALVAQEKQDFLSGKRPYTRVWNIIVFEMWREQWAPTAAVSESCSPVAVESKTAHS